MQMLGRQSTYGVVLAIISVAVLSAGFLLKPTRTPQQTQASQITTIQGEVVRLRDLAQRNTLRGMGSRFASVATDSAEHLILTARSRQTGVILGERTVLLPETVSIPGTITLEIEGRRLSAEPRVWGAGLGFVAAEVTDGSLVPPPARDQSTPLEIGAWVLLVRLGQSGQPLFSSGTYSGISTESCGLIPMPRLITGIPLDESTIGAGIFELDGDLVGAVVQCGDEPAAVPVEELYSFIAAWSDPAVALPFKIGALFTEMDEPWQAVANLGQGILVTDVWTGWPAAEAGLAPGDVVVSANEHPVETVAELMQALQASAQVNLQVRRGRQLRQLVLNRDLGPGSVVFRDDQGIRLQRIPAGSGLARAGFMPGDQITAVNGRRTPATIRRALSQSLPEQPVMIAAVRGSRQFVRVVLP